jgi:acetyl-CoA hydrolase
MDWNSLYRSRVTSAEEAVKEIRSGDRVWVHPGCNTPTRLLEAMVARAPELEDVEVVHILTLAEAPYADPGMEGHFRHRSLFTGGNVRQAVNEGRADFVPIHLHDIPALISRGQMPVDVALVHISPPDEHGFCSFGVGVDATKTAVEHARTVIALINRQMPRALGDSFVHVSKLGKVVEVDDPLIEHPMSPEVSDVARKIGENIASLITDGATIQMGIGEIPDAVLDFLEDKKHLGVHTEMFSDGLVDLFEAGVVTNERKTLHRGKIVASFVIGTRRAFDFVDNNPFMEFHPSEYVNDPYVVSRNDKMVAINSAISIDLTGQVCADSIGIHPRRRAVGGGRADHRPAVDRQGWQAVAARRHARPRIGGGDDSRRCPLRGHRVRHRRPLWPEHQGAGAQPDRHRPPRLPRGARARSRGAQAAVMS